MPNNWGRNYNANRTQNLTHSNYAQGNAEDSCEIWTDYEVSNGRASGSGRSIPQHLRQYISNGTVQNEVAPFHGTDYTLTNGQTALYNMEFNSEILARAANSQLTATAGEFIPSAAFHSTNTPQSLESLNGQHNYINHKGKGSGNSTRGKFTLEQSDNNYRRSLGKSKTRNSGSQRQLSVEQSKAAGREKLLQEAAGVTVPDNGVAGPSRGSNTSYDPFKKQHKGSNERPNRNSNHSLENKGYARFGNVQDYYRPQRHPTPKKTQPVPFKKEIHKFNHKDRVDDAAPQRDRLTDQLNKGTLECLVCCELVWPADATWSCPKCYHVFHLSCIKTWAGTSKSESGWRCPACQNVTVQMPNNYYCFCGKMVSPSWNPSDTAHSCGETCDRHKVMASEHYSCIHRCTLLCHPGPCPSCSALVTRKCGCERSSQTVQCGQVQLLMCGSACGKPLTCGVHMCTQQCHFGPCQPCQITLKQKCHCGKESRELTCDGQTNEEEMFSCGAVCEVQLACGHHKCKQRCHEGPCGSCPWDPARVTHCCCGNSTLSDTESRVSCLDPIPTCGLVCAKPLPCGQPSNPHQCKATCHQGDCPPCELSTLVRCRCGFMDREIPCTELTSKADDARCQKKCTKKRLCGKHKCNQLCCIGVDHLCPLPCNHMLTCGRHRCEQLCHRGPCKPCLQSSFEELYCECGSSVLLPPVPCGTKPPLCKQPCSRRHDCDHQVLHSCHSYPQCPPCGILTTKHCHGKHELRKAVPCHMKMFSCGRPCRQDLSCGRHKCIQLCHEGPCPAVCKQPCIKPRELCGHPCNAPCHDGDCVETPCKEKVVVTCECGHRSMSRPCFENNSEYHRIATSLLASKMADVQLGRSINLDDMQGTRKFSIKSLECSEECRIVERNRRLAIGLQIRNPDLSAKLTPRYSDFMRTWAKKDHRFCESVHEKLTELVKLAKQSKQKSRSCSFETMNREKRMFVHEYCSHFGCESAAYDAEPKRNVVATAQRDKAWLPSYSLLEVVQREMGLRKVPLPNFNSNNQKSISQRNLLPLKVGQVRTVPHTDNEIDYFEYNG